MPSAYEAPFLKFGNKSLFVELRCHKPVCWRGDQLQGLMEAEGRWWLTRASPFLQALFEGPLLIGQAGGLALPQCSTFAKLGQALQSHPLPPTRFYSPEAKCHREQCFSVFKNFIWK